MIYPKFILIVSIFYAKKNENIGKIHFRVG